MIKQLLPVLLTATASYAGLVSDVRTAAGSGNFETAAKLVSSYQQDRGATAELALAVSWIVREAVKKKDYALAERYAAQARELSLELLKSRELDEERTLPTALGASIEVAARVMAGRRELSEAVAFLDSEVERWSDTSIRPRIQKNLHLLSLEGKPAPPLELADYVGAKPLPLADLKGKVLLLYFWAHWCPDCKLGAPVLARLAEEYADKGLVVIGPSQRYGFVARGESASAAVELAYIEKVRSDHYGAVKGMPVPVSVENFARYGSSTTPTVVLVDRKGIVRLYHPGGMSYEELAPKVAALAGP